MGTRYLKSSGAAAIWQKSSCAAAYRYTNKKVAPLPLLACKTAAAAATLQNKYYKERWHSNMVSNGEISTLFTKVNYSSLLDIGSGYNRY